MTSHLVGLEVVVYGDGKPFTYPIVCAVDLATQWQYSLPGLQAPDYWRLNVEPGGGECPKGWAPIRLWLEWNGTMIANQIPGMVYRAVSDIPSILWMANKVPSNPPYFEAPNAWQVSLRVTAG